MSDVSNRWPGADVATAAHERSQREPETVENREVVGEGRAVRTVLDLPLAWAEPADEEQDAAHRQIREHDRQPHLAQACHVTSSAAS